MSKAFVVKSLRPLTVAITFGRYTFDATIGMERDEERGSCWRFNVGALELRWWLKK